ncbi:pectinesterase family protein [Pedobacter sp. ASV28]|uniref:pectinesterase family protein n=1 Tax=Pedobacter sp. ASV28 TaxID=2795123 RepID=UPI0018EBA9C8|nr:pectinesterase family protein [Pedobacter sp. ASV28]
MNKKLYLFFYLLFFSVPLWAQTTETATWSLANATGLVSGGGLIATDQVLGNAISGVQYNSTFGTISGWQRVGSTAFLPINYNENSYVEYTLKVPVGKKFTLTNINLSALGGGTGSARMAIYYSLDGFLNSFPAGAISYNGASYTNDQGNTNSVALLNTSTASLTGQQVANVNVANIEVAQNKTLSIRIYVWITGTGNRYFASKDFKLTGTLSDDTSPIVTQYALTTSVSPANAGTVSRTPNAVQYDEGSNVSLLATANFGYRFAKWVDANTEAELSTANPYLVTINAAKSIKAVFDTKVTYNFSVATTGSAWGEVKLNPLPTNGKYEEGTEVTVEVVPNPVVTFSKWENNTTATQRVITVNSDQSLTATFDEIPFIVGWNFKDQNTKVSKLADYYSESTNTGTLSAFEPTGVAVNWLSNPGAFSPSYPNARLWTSGANFVSTRRYLQAQFSTTGYHNIQVRSMVSANYQAYKVMTLQYSTNGTTFTEVARVDITDVYNSAWKNLDVTLPAGAENQTRIYLRWVADPTSGLLGGSADNDGSAFTNIYVYADKEVINDTDAPVLISTVPANGSNTATINGAVVLTFNERVKAGVGNVTLGAKTLVGTFGSKTVTFPYEKLNYNTAYTVTVPAGALTDMSGNAYTGITFTFTTGTRAQPTMKLFDVIVAQDGSGDYTNITAAIAAAPTDRTVPWLIFVKNGTYTGHHDIPVNKPFLHLIGQSRNGVVITDNRLSGDDGQGSTVYSVSLGATMVVNSANCYFENITFENSKGYVNLTGPQALALYTPGDKFSMNNCYLRSYQDTYLTAYSSLSARHYIKQSRIDGAVDFIYGGGDVFFDRDTLVINRAAGGYIVAPSHQAGTVYGYVFSNTVIAKDRVASVDVYLGRPWQNAPKTVFIHTKLSSNVNIYPQGWYYKMGAIPAVFADYGTTNAAGGAVDMSQRISNYEYDIKDGGGNVTSTVTGTAKNTLTDLEAAAYTYENVILRSGDTWDPRMIAEAPDKPLNLTLTNHKLTWSAVNYTRLYIITRNEIVIGFSLANEFTDNTATIGTNYSYKVQAVSEYGALSAASDVIQVLPVTGLTFNAKKVGQTAALTWTTYTEHNTSHFTIERSTNGTTFQTIGRREAAGESSALRSYLFNDVNPSNGYNYYRVRAVDKDAKFSESGIMALQFDFAGSAALIYPNPVVNHSFNMVLSLPKSEKITIRITSVEGKILQTETSFWPQGRTVRQLDLAKGMVPGIYIVNLIGETHKETLKLWVK